MEEYSSRTLTYHYDKLPAPSAIAHTINEPPDRYLARLWYRWLLRLLTWRSTKPESASRHAIIAPSWSWASLAGEFQSILKHPDIHFYGKGRFRDLAEVVECSAAPMFGFVPYGEIINSRLVLIGHLGPTSDALREATFHKPDKHHINPYTGGTYDAANRTIKVACFDSLLKNVSVDEKLYSLAIISVTNEKITGTAN